MACPSWCLSTWFNQLFRYALVKVEGIQLNPASDLDVVALPKPPVANNPDLLMEQLPDQLKAVRQYGGHLQTEVSVLTSQQPKPADQREHTEQCPAPNWEFDGSRRYRTNCAGLLLAADRSWAMDKVRRRLPVERV
jgi:hypothetical protein